MPKKKSEQKFAEVKKVVPAKLRQSMKKDTKSVRKEEKAKDKELLQLASTPSTMFFQYNEALGPPYHILVDTNFINFSIQNKLEILSAMMDCLYAKCTVYITDCVMAELEKFGAKYRVALRIAKDPRFERLPCDHKGTYADDCLVQRAMKHRCFIVATCDKDLQRRIRKIPGVPIMKIWSRKYTIERLPEAYGAPDM